MANPWPENLSHKDQLYHAVGAVIMSWGRLDAMIEIQLLCMQSVNSRSPPDANKNASLPAESRFSQRLTLLRRAHVQATMNDKAHMSRVDAWLTRLRRLEAIRSALAHGIVSQLAEPEGALVTRHWITVTGGDGTRSRALNVGETSLARLRWTVGQVQKVNIDAIELHARADELRNNLAGHEPTKLGSPC